MFDLGELYKEYRAEASNMALVRGRDIGEAVKATRRAFAASVRTDAQVLANPDNAKVESSSLWLVVYFGMGPSTPGFGRVQSTEVRSQTIRVAYSRARPGAATADIVFYYLWVPLGKAGAGAYALELFDADRNEVTLLRHTVVTGS
ncbi:MAG: hypothetical protein U0746_05355 [Gemmataceae bacterium]